MKRTTSPGGRVVFDRLAEIPLVAQYEQAFLQATGIPLNLVSANPASDRFHLKRHDLTICRMLSRNQSAAAACRKCETRILSRTIATRAPQSLNCFAGLNIVAVPVFVNQQHVATWVSRLSFTRTPTPARLALLEKRLHEWGMDRSAPQIIKDLMEKQSVTPKKLRALKQLLGLFARQLGENAERALLQAQEHDPQIVRRAKEFIQAHLKEELSLDVIAQGANVSPYHLCRVFHATTGITLKEHISTLRVELAKKLLSDFSLRIVDAAFEAGFGSIPQFNAVFRKFTGMSPSQYRVSLGKTPADRRRPDPVLTGVAIFKQ